MDDLRDGHWHHETITRGLIQSERIRQVYFKGRTEFQEIAIVEAECFGRSLILDGKTQSTEVDEFVYHEALVHPSMLVHPDPRTVFVAGGGEGATIREVLSHRSVARAVMVDIDRQVVEACREHLPNHHRGSFDDPRLELHDDDAFRFLEQTGDRYDVAVIDVPDPLEQGPAYRLFTREFYSLLRERLNPGGIMVAQAGPTGPAFYEQCFSAVANTVASVFPERFVCEAFVPSFGSTWGFVIGSLGPEPSSLTPVQADKLIASRVQSELRYLDGATMQGMFAVPKYLRHALATETRIITLDDPLFVV
jgi:spermidine synthase